MEKKEFKTLLIESNVQVARKIEKELKNKGCVVSTTYSVDTALIRCKAFQFDFFVVNCGDSGKAGVDFYKKLKQSYDLSDIPFLFVFNSDVKVDLRLLKLNIRFNFIKLPFDATELNIRFERLFGFKATEEDDDSYIKENEVEDEALKRILLVEDNPLNQKVLGMFIDRLNFDHDVASNGQMAVDLANDKDYAYILMDIYMPGMDGTEATVSIRENEEKFNKKRSKIIAITANESDESVKRCYDSGMDDYLVKPFTLEVLKEKLV
ncbi:MAG: response regulator [Prolixibacteraceae bacterium]|jgi:CheY-like chemotaxis protein|nr:response regulator [Prolixibacteraceae bacterium]